MSGLVRVSSTELGSPDLSERMVTTGAESDPLDLVYIRNLFRVTATLPVQNDCAYFLIEV